MRKQDLPLLNLRNKTKSAVEKHISAQSIPEFALSVSLNKTFPSYLPEFAGVRCTSVVQRPLMVRCVVGSILQGGFIKLCLVPAIAQQLV